DVNDILYATVSDGSIKVVAREIEGTASFRSLDELERELAGRQFIRVHKSYVANMNRIYEVTPWFNGSYQIRMEGKGGPVIPLSRAQARELRKIVKW
ncbi:MAG TPA: LytTR family DNA-binding domain-containing protein, partial [Candidatus Bathyarchaeia archaeon]|nr:LytTR family DNA-binding domain-containing protein [Candidatus Bathyarchaeia archaeon]